MIRKQGYNDKDLKKVPIKKGLSINSFIIASWDVNIIFIIIYISCVKYIKYIWNQQGMKLKQKAKSQAITITLALTNIHICKLKLAISPWLKYNTIW